MATAPRTLAQEGLPFEPLPTKQLKSGMTEADYDAALKEIGTRPPSAKAALYKSMRDDGFTDAAIRAKVEAGGVKQRDEDWLALQRLAGFEPAVVPPTAPPVDLTAPPPGGTADITETEGRTVNVRTGDPAVIRLNTLEDTGPTRLDADVDETDELNRQVAEALAAEQARLDAEATAEQERLDREAAAAEAERQRLYNEEQARLNAENEAAARARQAEIDAELAAGRMALEGELDIARKTLATDIETARRDIDDLRSRETAALEKLRADEQARLDVLARQQADELLRLQIQRESEQAGLNQQLEAQRQEQARIKAGLSEQQAVGAAAAERNARELEAMRLAGEADLRGRRDEMQRTSAMRVLASQKAGRSATARPLLAGADMGAMQPGRSLGVGGSLGSVGSLGVMGTLGAAGGLR